MIFFGIWLQGIADHKYTIIVSKVHEPYSHLEFLAWGWGRGGGGRGVENWTIQLFIPRFIIFTLNH